MLGVTDPFSLATTSGVRFLGGLGVTDPFMLAPTSGARFLGELAKLEALESLEVLGRLESLERLEPLESLERLEPLENLASLESLAVNIEGVNFIVVQGFKGGKSNHFFHHLLRYTASEKHALQMFKKSNTAQSTQSNKRSTNCRKLKRNSIRFNQKYFVF